MSHDLMLILLGGAIFQILLTLWKLLTQTSLGKGEILYALLNFSALFYLLNQTALFNGLGWLMGPIYSAIPALFWLCCGQVFQDDFHLGWRNISLALVTVVFPMIYNLWLSMFSPPIFSYWLLAGFPQLLEFVLLFWALFIVLAYLKDDLVARRRSLRFWVFSFLGLSIFARIFEQQVAQLNNEWFEIAFLAVNLCFIMALNGFFLSWRTPIFASTEHLLAGDGKNPLLLKLNQLMSQTRHYRNHGLTIVQLAESLNTTPYKLRALINGELGFRNFNVYLNSLRIDEAAQRLQEEAEPVLNIALDVGFKSLSSFNKTFKDRYNKTPSEYRHAVDN